MLLVHFSSSLHLADANLLQSVLKEKINLLQK